VKKIPLFNLALENNPLKIKIMKSWSEIYDNNSFTSGKETIKFEKDFSNLCNTRYALGVHSGTDSLIITLKAAGIKSGDEVITTPCTFTATTDAIIHSGAKPIFADVDQKTGNILPDEIENKITSKTKAILLVHLYGVPCEMDKIKKIAKNHKIFIIEDSSHAHGSLYKGKPVGSFGLAGCFSLYPSKPLGSMGNAGVITSNNKAFIDKARSYANHGILIHKNKYEHFRVGFNKLIDNLQSAVLIHKIPTLKQKIVKKISIAKKYNEAFSKIDEPGMYWPNNTEPSLYVYSIQTKKIKEYREHFSKHSIEANSYYPIPLHLQPSLKFLGYKKGDFPNAEKFFSQTLSIPLFPQLTESEVNHIVKTISLLKKNN